MSETISKADAIQAVNAEPELPGPMPDEIWEALRNDRDLMTVALRQACSATKKNIIERIHNL